MNKILFQSDKGPWVEVIATFLSIKDANAYMEKNSNAALIGKRGGVYYLADVNDKGIKL